MTDHKHEFKQKRSHHAWNQCVCGMLPYSQAHAKELEARAEKAEAEVERLSRAIWPLG